jgi:hypothetical protein
VEQGGGADFPIGSRVMFTGPYGVFESGAYGEWLAVRKESLCLIPEGVDDVSAAGIPVAYLTAQMALTLAGFHAGKTVLAPAIGGSVGNAVTQLARALDAKHAISSTTNRAKPRRVALVLRTPIWLSRAPSLKCSDEGIETFVLVGIARCTRLKLPFLAIPKRVVIGGLRRVMDYFAVAAGVSGRIDPGNYAVGASDYDPIARANRWAFGHPCYPSARVKS